MAIEFYCTQCNKLLRTGEGTAGKQAKCPECGAVVMIPAAGTAPSGQAPPPRWVPGDEAGSPFSPGGPAAAAFDPENPYAAPSDYAQAPPTYAPIGAVAHQIIDFGDVFSRTWAIFKVQWGMCLAVLILVLVVNFGVNIVIMMAFGILGAIAADPVIAGMANIMSQLVSSLFGMWIGLGQSLYFLRIARGQQASLGDIFAGGPYFLSFLLAAILVVLILLPVAIVCFGPAGLVLAISGDPGAALAVLVAGAVVFLVAYVFILLMFSQIKLLILDRNVGPIEALSLSRRITTGNKLMILVISLVASMVGGLLCLVTCFLGLLAVAPFLALLYPVIYLAMTGQRTADQMLSGGPAVR